MVSACVELDATMTRRLRRNSLRGSPSPVRATPPQIRRKAIMKLQKCGNGDDFTVVGEK